MKTMRISPAGAALEPPRILASSSATRLSSFAIVAFASSRSDSGVGAMAGN